MSPERLCIVYWASVRMLFFDYLRHEAEARKIPVEEFQFEHHASWFSERRSYVRNIYWLLMRIIALLIQFRGCSVVFFGTNLCRILWPLNFLFKNIVFIVNELPVYKPGIFFRLLRWYDGWWIGAARLLAVSNSARARWLADEFDLSALPLVVPNIPADIMLFKPSMKKLEDVAVYFGLLSDSRWSELTSAAVSEALITLAIKSFNVYGPDRRQVSGPAVQAVNPAIHDTVSRKVVADILGEARWAVLAYSVSDVNNRLCAPIKVYEYLAAGCTVVSVSRNESLVEMASQGASIWFVDDLRQSYLVDMKSSRMQNGDAQQFFDLEKNRTLDAASLIASFLFLKAC